MRIGIAFVTLLFAASCRRAPPPSSSDPAPAAADPTVEAAEIFATRCAACHGATGEGNGPAAAALRPPPTNFHDHTWQQATPDGRIEQIIRLGGIAVGKSAAMPPNPDIADRPALIAALRTRVRSFAP